jgi:RNA polymerase sigma-70 factor (family 1)
MFKVYYDPLCRYVARYVGSRDVAEDVVEDVFVWIWQERERWEVRGPLHPYLFAAARCRAINHLRHDAVRDRAAPRLSLDPTYFADPAPADAVAEAEELRHRVDRTLAALPPRMREAFVLSRDEGLSYDEVAFRMGISVKTVGVHISRALAALRKAILTMTGLAALLH